MSGRQFSAAAFLLALGSLGACGDSRGGGSGNPGEPALVTTVTVAVLSSEVRFSLVRVSPGADEFSFVEGIVFAQVERTLPGGRVVVQTEGIAPLTTDSRLDGTIQQIVPILALAHRVYVRSDAMLRNGTRVALREWDLPVSVPGPTPMTIYK